MQQSQFFSHLDYIIMSIVDEHVSVYKSKQSISAVTTYLQSS